MDDVFLDIELMLREMPEAIGKVDLEKKVLLRRFAHNVIKNVKCRLNPQITALYIVVIVFQSVVKVVPLKAGEIVSQEVEVLIRNPIVGTILIIARVGKAEGPVKENQQISENVRKKHNWNQVYVQDGLKTPINNK